MNAQSKFYCTGFKPVRAERFEQAARIFAQRQARREFGRSGHWRTCNETAWSNDGKWGEFQAFIGSCTGPNETTGHNIYFTVYLV